MGVNFVIVGYWQPLARYGYEQLDFELRSGALGAAIKVGEFTAIEDRVALRIEESRDEGRQLMGIFARIANDKGQVLSISAREGRFLANREDRNTIILRLSDGTIVQDMPGQTPRVLSFTQHDLPIDLPRIEEFRARGGEAREYLLPELFELGWREDDVADATRVEGQAAFSYRMVEVVMMLMLPLLAVALAIPPKRSTSALGRVRVDRDGGRLPQDQPVRAGGRRARPGRPAAGAVGPVRAVRGADRVDVLPGLVRARRAGDRRARERLRQADEADPRADQAARPRCATSSPAQEEEAAGAA